jgi:hypothetical protein
MANMTPKEKSEELIQSFTFKCFECDNAKQSALIAVEEILKNNCGANTDGQQAYENELYCDEYFWYDVKQELEKL